MKILIVEPFFTGSHKSWSEEYKKHSKHQIEILGLPGRFWKWRMHGGAITLAKRYEKLHYNPDLILATDMLNLPVFKSLITSPPPIALYFHENQFTYPWSPKDLDVILKRDRHYGFINYSSALTANSIYFNSQFHLDSFISGLQNYLNECPDYREINNIEKIKQKSSILYLGLDLRSFDPFRKINNNPLPLILWNHRWEHDKNPEFFFNTLQKLSEKNINFQLAVIGKEFKNENTSFTIARNSLKKHIIQFGHVNSFEEYAEWLWKADFLPVTSNQDFFGASIMEAVYCNTIPLLPNRLTYPELFHRNKYPELFYNDENNLIIKLEKLLTKINNLNHSKYQNIAKQYDWGRNVTLYDKTFENQLNQ